MTVRRARPEDAAAVADVHVRTWQVAYEHVFGAERLASMDTAARVSTWKRRLDATDLVWVAEDDDGRIAGFVYVGDSRDEDGAGELYAIYVLAEAWGTDAGRSLMAAGLEGLRSAGYVAATLWVLEDNPRARRFYEREGWALDGARKTDEFLGIAVNEVRYRIDLRSTLLL